LETFSRINVSLEKGAKNFTAQRNLQKSDRAKEDKTAVLK